jgi:hypothetical protein
MIGNPAERIPAEVVAKQPDFRPTALIAAIAAAESAPPREADLSHAAARRLGL